MKNLIGLLLILSACAPKIGPQGPTGTNAQPCTASPVEDGELITCPGSPSQIIYDGATGSTGATGPQGDPGATGEAGTIITPIQLCPGITPTYPSSFPESALCIDGNLYGVYSANGGFLALLPPGDYSSDGINASCSFTITDECGIINQ